MSSGRFWNEIVTGMLSSRASTAAISLSGTSTTTSIGFG